MGFKGSTHHIPTIMTVTVGRSRRYIVLQYRVHPVSRTEPCMFTSPSIRLPFEALSPLWTYHLEFSSLCGPIFFFGGEAALSPLWTYHWGVFPLGEPRGIHVSFDTEKLDIYRTCGILNSSFGSPSTICRYTSFVATGSRAGSCQGVNNSFL